MAENKPYKDRQDPAYLTYLEDQIEQACARSVRDSQSISTLVARLDVIEVSSRGRKGSTNPLDDDFDQNTVRVETVPGSTDKTATAGDSLGSLRGSTPADVLGGPLTSAL